MPYQRRIRSPRSTLILDQLKNVEAKQQRALRLLETSRLEEVEKAFAQIKVSEQTVAKARAGARTYISKRRQAAVSKRSAATNKKMKEASVLADEGLRDMRKALKLRHWRTPEIILQEAVDRSLHYSSSKARRQASGRTPLHPSRLIVHSDSTSRDKMEQQVRTLLSIPKRKQLSDFGISVTTLFKEISTDSWFVIEFGFPRSTLSNELHNIAFALRRKGSFRSVLPELIDMQLAETVRIDFFPETERRTDWHIRDIKADQAWRKKPPNNGKQFGEGVVIAHPDSGWQEHNQYDESQIDKARAHNSISGQTGSNHARHGFPNNFNWAITHGTATGSALVSGRDSRTHSLTVSNADLPPQSIAENRVSILGVAPKATIIPIKCVSDTDLMGVVRINDVALARAIEYAIIADADVISISLGGFAHPATRVAVQAAIDAGLIVIAAAGQSRYVDKTLPYFYDVAFSSPDTVIEPARYPDVVAVVGTTPKRRPWGESHFGQNADIAAPATGVWIADFDSDTHDEVMRAGDGTSFATAIVAGSAAVWLAYWGKPFLRNKYDGSQTPLAHAFHEALRLSADHRDGSADRLDGNWDRSLYGAGIINLDRLLSSAALPDSVPLPNRGTRNLFESIGDGLVVIHDTLEFLKDIARSSVEQAEALARTAAMWVLDQVETGIQALEDVYTAVSTVATEAAGAIRKTAEETLQAIEDTLDDFIDAGEEAARAAAEMAEDMIEAAEEVFEGAADAAGEAAEDFVDWATDTWNSLFGDDD